MYDQPQTPSRPMVSIAENKKTLADVLGAELDQKAKLRQIQQKYQSYPAKEVPRNNGMLGPNREVYL